MKKESISVQMEAEKLRAVKRYMEKKEVDIHKELYDQLQKLYERFVPINVREYIDETALQDIQSGSGAKNKKGENKVYDSRNDTGNNAVNSYIENNE